MGLQSHFIVADPSDAATVCARILRSGEGVWTKWVHEPELTVIFDALEVRESKERTLGPVLFAAAADGPWVHEVSSALVEALAAISDEAAHALAPSIASALREISCAGVNFGSEATGALLGDLAGLCRVALMTRSSVLFVARL